MNVYLSPSVQEWNKGVAGYGTEEERMNELADHMEPLLKANGFKVYRNKPTMTLEQVVRDSINKIGKNGIHFALHSNAGGGQGTEIFHYTGSVEGKKLATAVYKRVAPLTPSKDRGIKHNKVFRELSAPYAPSVLLEVGFHDNKQDALYIMNNMEELAEGIVKGICDYAGKTFKSKQVKKKTSKPKTKSKSTHRVIVGSFKNLDNAKDHKKDLEKDGFEVFISNYKGMNRVIAGSFENKNNAVVRQKQLKKKGYDSFIEIIRK